MFYEKLGCSVIARAIRIDVIEELCGFSEIGGSPFSGVCLIDKDSTERFGGGRLQDYAINSNTEGGKFVTNIAREKLDTLPPERTAGTCLEDLKSTESGKLLNSLAMNAPRMPSSSAAARLLLTERFDRRVAPLETVGAFLRTVGSTISQLISSRYPRSSHCLTHTTTLSVRRVLPCSPPSSSSSFDGWEVRLSCGPSGEERVIFARSVLLCTGGRQDPLPSLRAAHASKLVSSDDLISATGFRDVAATLHRHLQSLPATATVTVTSNGTVNGTPRVVIIGGSHSGFSAAWMLIYRLQQHLDLFSGHPTPSTSPTPSTAPAPSPSPRSGASPQKKQGPRSPSPLQIFLLHRSPIRIFYESRAEAERDGYSVGAGRKTCREGR